jgi:hypothetical protein
MTISNILNASFKGIPFFVESERLLSFGRSLAKHQYPNTSEQYLEDTGGFAREFEVEGFVIGKDSKYKITALINACNEEGVGRLVLPFFGDMQVKAGEGSIDVIPYGDNEKIYFTMYFCESRAEAGFIKGSSTLSKVLSLAQSSRDSLLTSFSQHFSLNKLDSLSNLCAQSSLRQIIRDVGNIAKFIPSLEKSNLFSNLDTIIGSISDLIKTPSQLAQSLVGSKGIYTSLSTGLIGNYTPLIFSTLIDLSDTFESKQTTSISSLTLQSEDQDFEISDSSAQYWKNDTKNRQLRNILRRTLAEIHRLNLLLLAYETFAGMVFDTDSQVDITRSAIELEYIDLVHGIHGIKDGLPIIKGNEDKTPFLVDDNTFYPFDEARLSALDCVNNSKVVKYKVETERNDSYYGSSILNLAYLTQAESLTDEAELIDIAYSMREANNRRTYFISGDFIVLRKGL